MVRRTSAMGAAATMFAVLAAVGCSGGSSGGGASSTASHASKSVASGGPVASRSSTVSKSPTSKSSLTTATPKPSGTAAGAPGVPEPARQHTEAGAEAFVAHYLRVMNKAAETPTPKPLAPVSQPGCKTCKEWAEVFTTLIKDRTHYDGPVFEQPTIKRTLKIDANTYHLFFNLRQSAANIRHAEGGDITEHGERSSMKVVFELTWTKQGWRTVEVQKDV